MRRGTCRDAVHFGTSLTITHIPDHATNILYCLYVHIFIYVSMWLKKSKVRLEMACYWWQTYNTCGISSRYNNGSSNDNHNQMMIKNNKCESFSFQTLFCSLIIFICLSARTSTREPFSKHHKNLTKPFVRSLTGIPYFKCCFIYLALSPSTLRELCCLYQSEVTGMGKHFSLFECRIRIY